MAYKEKNGLPNEKANKLNHIDIPKNPLINELLNNMTINKNIVNNLFNANWSDINLDKNDFKFIITVDGSVSFVEDKLNNIKGVFVKVGTLILDKEIMDLFKTRNSIDPRLKENINKNCFTNSITFFPLTSSISYKQHNLYNSIRHLIYDSLVYNKDNLDTLKFLIYKKWQLNQNDSEFFDCPHCVTKIKLPYDSNELSCPSCNEQILISDFLGFHKNFSDDSENISQKIATDYMLINETLTMFTHIRKIVDIAIAKKETDILNKLLFLKDGPLSLNGIYSKLVNYINSYLQFCEDKKININLIGQEKTGTFVDFFDSNTNYNQYLILNNDLIRKHISPDTMQSTKPYGKDTMYGQKVFINFKSHKLIISFNNKGNYKENPTENDFVNFSQNLSVLKSLLSYNYANSLMPIMMVNDRTSLSLNPTKNILEDFLSKFFKN